MNAGQPILGLDESHCVQLAPENGLHPIYACEYNKTYQLRVVDRWLRYQKAEFHEKFTQHLVSFFSRSALPGAHLASSEVNVWLAAPLFEPERAFLVAVVEVDGGRLTVRLPLEIELWALSGDSVAWLGRAPYPSQNPRRIDRLLLYAQPTITKNGLREYLVNQSLLQQRGAHGTVRIKKIHGDGTALALETEPFAAPLFARILRNTKDYERYISRIDYVLADSQELYRVKAFNFYLPGNIDNHNQLLK